MTIKTKTRVLSAETKISRKTNNQYTLLNFMDGAQVVNAMVEQGVPVNNLVPFNEYELIIDFNLRYGSARVIAIGEV